MSIKEERKRARAKSPTGKYPEPYVVPETTIREYVESLGILDVDEAATQMQAVADATSRTLDQQTGQLKPAELRLILRIAAESKDRRQQSILKAIITAVGQGPDGINAAALTADRSVELAFRWTRAYISAFDQYRDGLREKSLVDEDGQTITQNQELRLVSNSR